MARVAPVTTPGIVDRYLADKIFGFPIGGALLAASTGPLSTQAAEYASEFDHDFEVATPYHYSAELQTWGIHVDVTSTRAAVFYRFTFPASSHSHLMLSSEEGSELHVVNDHVLEGSRRVEGVVAPLSDPNGSTRQYFYLEVSKPFAAYQTWSGEELSRRSTQGGGHIGFVSVTLETAYDDWAVAQLAKAMGHSPDAAYFSKLAANYRNVFNPAINFMAPRSADGKWVTPFDPKLGGGQGARDYFTEVNSWLYTFNVQFDVAGLVDLWEGGQLLTLALTNCSLNNMALPSINF